MANIQQGDIGTDFIGTVKEDGIVVSLVGASSKSIVFEKPDGTLLTKAANFVTDGSNGKIHYVSILGDIDQPGQWSMQGFVTLAMGWNGHTERVSFWVDPSLG
jgi:hypothetical protein